MARISPVISKYTYSCVDSTHFSHPTPPDDENFNWKDFMLMVLIFEQFNFINSFVILFLFVLIDKIVDCCICFANQQWLQRMKSEDEKISKLGNSNAVGLLGYYCKFIHHTPPERHQMCCLLSVCGRLLCFGWFCYQQVHHRHLSCTCPFWTCPKMDWTGQQSDMSRTYPGERLHLGPLIWDRTWEWGQNKWVAVLSS